MVKLDTFAFIVAEVGRFKSGPDGGMEDFGDRADGLDVRPHDPVANAEERR